MNPELDFIIADTDNKLEAFFALIIYGMVAFIFSILEVVIEFNEDA